MMEPTRVFYPEVVEFVKFEPFKEQKPGFPRPWPSLENIFSLSLSWLQTGQSEPAAPPRVPAGRVEARRARATSLPLSCVAWLSPTPADGLTPPSL